MEHHKEKSAGNEFKIFIAQNIVWVMLALVIIGGSFAKDWLQDKWRYNEFTLHQLDKDSVQDLAITDILYKMIEQTKADRAYIFRFHNGGYLAGMIPFKKTSCTHEVVKVGVSREINNLKDIPLSTIPDFTQLLVANEDSFILQTSKLRHGTLRSIFESEAIQFAICHRIMRENEVWGFVGIDYIKSSLPAELGCSPYAAFDVAAHLIGLEIIKNY